MSALVPDADGQFPAGTFVMELGGSEHRFRFDFYCLMKLEELTGEDMLHASAAYLDPRYMSITRFCQLMWAMAVYEEPDLTVAQVARWLTFAQAAAIEQAAQAIQAAMPAPEPEPPNGVAGPPPRSRPVRSKAG